MFDLPELALIPFPSHVKVGDGTFTIDKDTVFLAETAIDAEVANKLLPRLRQKTGFPLPRGLKETSNVIEIDIDPLRKETNDEGYQLRITPQKIDLRAKTEAGIFYGLQTLSQLKEGDFDPPFTYPCLRIDDNPRFRWRGLMLDVARHFVPKEAILKLIEAMAMVKLNSLHLHLTDDQGWRMEIKRYPKLTEVGAFRSETVVGRNSGTFDGKPHGGYYSQDDLKEIVAFAAQRYISIVPEIEMPGHAGAALAAYPELGNLSTSYQVMKEWGVNQNVYNVECSTLAFLKNVLDEVMAVFPSLWIHIGGDECPKEEWKSSERVQQLMKQRDVPDEEGLQSWFISQIALYLDSRGRRLLGWDEILEGGLAEGTTVMSWRGVAGGIAAAKAGHDVVMSPSSHCYFDFYQSRSKNEPLAIGQFLPLEKVYGFDPVPECLSSSEAKRILGCQANLWTEYVPNPAHMEYMMWPRAIALAEAAWSQPSQKNLDRFMASLPNYLRRLEQMGVNYRRVTPLPKPLAFWRKKEVTSKATEKHWSLGSMAPGSGTLLVTFQYSGGANRLEIQWAELLVNGQKVGRDEHPGSSGFWDHDNVYSFPNVTLSDGDQISLAAMVKTEAGNDSNGEIYCSFATGEERV
ncbi:MAG: beta-N-acetylhexosaminidase [Fimbriimonadaceae bacterium]|jgi:hexosaminidase|nr:beta-N-acetylhexosaminidase [Fimbriimonadaceae bacterium]